MKIYIYIHIYIVPQIGILFRVLIQSQKLEWKPAGRVFSRTFSQTFTSVSITYGTRKENVFYFFYKLTRRKLKRGNCILFFLLICVVSTSVSTKMFPVSYVLNKNHDKKDNNVCSSVYKLYNCARGRPERAQKMICLSYVIRSIHTQFTKIKLFQSWEQE